MLMWLLVWATLCSAEIIEQSKLKQKSWQYELKRDLFSLEFKSADNLEKAQEFTETAAENHNNETVIPLIDLETEVRRSVLYEGYIRRKNKLYALLNVNGDYLAAAKDDWLLDKIRVLKIDVKYIDILVNGSQFKIMIKETTNDK
jgi:hypothetical protein